MGERSKLSALLTGVMSAVQKAACTAGQQNLHVLDHYFEKDPKTGKLVPLYTRIEIAPGRVMDIPLITLLEPSGYALEELEMDLSIRLKLDAIKKAVHNTAKENNIQKGSFSVELCPRDHSQTRRSADVVDVKVKFKSRDASEGLSRIIEDLNNTITPVPEKDAPDRDTLTNRIRKHESEVITPFQEETEAYTDTDAMPVVLDDTAEEGALEQPETDQENEEDDVDGDHNT